MHTDMIDASIHSKDFKIEFSKSGFFLKLSIKHRLKLVNSCNI